jgi:hypothetical protein
MLTKLFFCHAETTVFESVQLLLLVLFLIDSSGSVEVLFDATDDANIVVDDVRFL